MSERNRELFGLVPSALLLTAGFTAIFIQQSDQLSNVSLTYGAIFLLLCLAAHLFLRIALPYADPYLFPLVAVLASFGLVMIYRLDEELAREQAQWFVVGLLLFGATIVFLRDYRVLERYRYTIAAVSIGLLMLPRAPGVGGLVNGAYLSISIGPITFQPAEFAKIGIVVFLASYLRDTRQVLVLGARRFLGLTFPPLKHFGPLLMAPRVPGLGGQVNGAFLAINIGPIQFQPAEFAKLGIIIFLASYLRETGDILVLSLIHI